MRYTEEHKAETRERILDEAAQRMRRDGICGTGLAPLMQGVGLTHGAFYAHFPTKQALVDAALDTAVEQSLERWPKPENTAQLRAFIDEYLSPQHRDDPGHGCPLSSLAAELGLRGTPNANTDVLVARYARRLDACTLEAGPHQGLVALAAMVGALTLARSVIDKPTSQRILEAVNAALSVSDGVRDNAPAVPAGPAAE
ncbi:TetR/AcrR family transcriptional regulator [Herbaspirillum sp. SJZ107]|uniref:TetR/AcrR family transcriptional regulator n=1 Tax=Herbaspirillum sp. SJZ107 TaxID=2572881 RepID=UPI0011518C6A|nr:TetR/AcrR family transcriptional regulator [Herbaspirillum sp. SJZ107]TQK11040.1 TetR family transcriptional regulator [Herbaspirillum sp. SJZ107]